MSRRPDARGAALQALGEVLDRRRSLAEVRAFDRLADERERAFARRLAYGVLRWNGALEWLSDQLLDRPLKRKERAVRRLLSLGLYQLWREDTAEHAAVHATADTARALGKPWAVGLVNAVLRRFQREKDTLLDALDARDERFAHPPWLLAALQQDWPEDWPAIATENNREPPLWLRHNARHGNREAGVQALREAGFEVREHALARDALGITPAAPVNAIPGFADGRFSVQDPAAQLAADLLDPRPGDRILDACAAPGGKTGHLLERCPEARVTALDLSAERLERVRENLERLNLRARLVAADATDTGAWWDQRSFRRILLDAPCSATGVIRRHPEIKWLRDPEQVEEAQALQGRLLRRLWPLLEAGGILVYATCSVLRRENDEQVRAFLEDHADARCTGPDGFGRDTQPGRQILPGDQGMDGFFYAVLEKHPV